MTDLRQAAQAVLDAWEELDGLDTETECVTIDVGDVIAALRAALEQQAEPVAWAVQGCSKMWRGEFAEIDSKAEAKRIGGTCVAYPLYTTPPQRQWVGLTDEEVKFIWKDVIGWGDPSHDDEDLVRAIEAKLRSKNDR